MAAEPSPQMLLFDVAPFGRGRLRELHEAKQGGAVKAPPAGSSVPRAVQAALVRGLAPRQGVRQGRERFGGQG